MDQDVRLESGELSPARELQALIETLGGEGAIVSFVGVARPAGRDGSRVTGLFLDHYPGMTEVSLAGIAEDAAARFGGVRTRIVHRVGQVMAGEPIVFAAAAARHRRAAFEAADYVMDRLKVDAAFWKREDHVEGSAWIEPTAQDRADRERWSAQCPE